MADKNLEEMVKTRNPVEMLRNSQLGAYVYPVVPAEFTNWRDEQVAWRKTAVLFDQSHHMAEMMVTGPDAFKFMNYLTINSFANFPVDRAKQFVPCSYDGYVIGDGILFNLADNQLNFVGRAPTVDWIEFHGKTGKFNIKMERDDRSPSRPGAKPVSRRHYRYQIQGPNAKHVLDKLNGAPMKDVKFFNMDYINIAGKKVRCLRHGMAGEPGLEIWGPWAEGDEIRNAILEAGKEFGIVAVGSRAYATIRWNPAGFRRRSPPSIPARSRKRSANGRRRKATPRPVRSPAASSPTRSRITIPRRTSWVTAPSSSSTTTSSAAKRWRRSRTSRIAARSRSRGTRTTSPR